MIWVVRQFITHQILDTGPERVKFPIRVELEYQEHNGEVSSESVHKTVLFNKSFLLRRYPQLKERNLDLLVEETIQKAIQDQLIRSEGTE
jgi:hypothetical protein